VLQTNSNLVAVIVDLLTGLDVLVKEFGAVSIAGVAVNKSSLAERIFVSSIDGPCAAFVFSTSFSTVVLAEEVTSTDLSSTAGDCNSRRQTEDVVLIALILPVVLIGKLRSEDADLVAQAKVDQISGVVVGSSLAVNSFKNQTVGEAAEGVLSANAVVVIVVAPLASVFGFAVGNILQKP